MGRNAAKYKKRPAQPPRDKTSLSANLRQIADHIHGHNYSAALTQANQILDESSWDEASKTRVISLIADSEFKQGRFANAAQIHLRAASRSLGSADLWLRAYVGQVRALLKIPQVEQAAVMARHAVELAKAKMADFDALVCTSAQELGHPGLISVPDLPPRVSVVATKMGYLFLGEGEPELAEEFFTAGVNASQGGANRARQGLAQLALMKGEYGQALHTAAEAIRLGGYKAKTLPAWPILIAARRKLGGWRISDRLLRGLDAISGELRARTILTIVRELRKSDMRQWREIANRWLKREGQQNPIIAAEIHKMILASSRVEAENPEDRRKMAAQFLQTPGLSPREWLAGAKELVRASLLDQRPVPTASLLSQAQAGYGRDFAPVAAHGLALACLSANHPEKARILLVSGLQQVSSGSTEWGKCIWSLARLEKQQGNHAASADLYRQYSETEVMPARFRLQAKLLWAEALVHAGQTATLLEARTTIDNLLGGIQEPEILLDFARQMSVSSPELLSWSNEIFNRGADLALRQFAAAGHPSMAVDILYKLTRRQVCDFDRTGDAIAQWESLGDEKVDWLWSQRANFWAYLGLIIRAYGMECRKAQVEAFSRDWLEDPATPPVGRVQIGIPYGRWLTHHQRVGDALLLFHQLVEESPTHPLCAIAWYWLALEAHKRGKVVERDRCVRCLRLATGTQGGDPQERDLEGKALLLLADLDTSRVDLEAANFDIADFNIFLEQIQQNMGQLP